MRKTNTIFWSVTILFVAAMLFSAVPEIMQSAESREFMKHLSYPDYFNPFIGWLKVLGVIAILLPGIPRLKEWAYAGFFFDLLGATYSQIASDGFSLPILVMSVFFILWGISYTYYHKRLNKMNMVSRRTVTS